MIKPAIPLDETLRLRSLQSLKILDSLPEERFDRITRIASRVFDVPIALVSLVDRDRQWFKARHGLDACETGREISFCGHAILEEATFVVCNALLDERFADNPLVVNEPRIRFYAGHPVHSPNGLRIGTLCIIDMKPRQFSAAEAETLRGFAEMVDHELAMLAQATTDELTRIANRRGFMQIATHMLALCRRQRMPATLIGIDLNGFKQINDQHGHEAGDAVLVDFARLLTRNFRDSDVVARLGGDEFCVLTSSCSADKAAASLDRLERMFRESDCAKRHPQLSWSAGIAEYDSGGEPDIEHLLRRADQHMYETKHRTKQQAGSAR